MAEEEVNFFPKDGIVFDWVQKVPKNLRNLPYAGGLNFPLEDAERINYIVERMKKLSASGYWEVVLGFNEAFGVDKNPNHPYLWRIREEAKKLAMTVYYEYDRGIMGHL